MRLIDKMMTKYGYTKTEENEYGVRYKRREPQNFYHIVCIVCKKSGRHLMHSYDAELIDVPSRTWAANECVGVEIPVLLLMWLKAKYLALKYHWERRSNGR